MEFSKQYQTLIILLFIITSFTVVAQNNKPLKIEGIKVEVKTNKSAYFKFDQGDYVFMYNKNNSLINIYSSFYDKSGSNQRRYSISDRPLIDSFVKKWIAPHFRNILKSDDKLMCIEINLFSDVDGNVKEIAITFLADCKLPLSAFESLENDILSSDVKLIFDKKGYQFDGATWVDYPLRYSFSKLKKMTTE